MGRYAIVDQDTGDVVNVVEWDGQAPYSPAGDLVEVPEGEPAEPGGTYTDGVWAPAEQAGG